MAKATKTEVMDLSKFKSSNLPELQGKKESIAEVIKNNPIKDITDNASYEDMKKSRTAVKTLRTSLERESKDVISKLKTIVIDSVKSEYETLILGVVAAELERQSKVDVWEAKKEEERKEKLRLEEERVDGIKAKINDFRDIWSTAFDLIKFENLEECENEFTKSLELVNQGRSEFQEFEVLFDRVVGDLLAKFTDKKKTIEEQEQIRLDNLIIEEKKAEQTKICNFQKEWNANIDTLKFEDVQGIKDAFDKSFKLGFKHFKDEFNEVFESITNRLHSQIEFISKQEEQRVIAEKQKIDADTLALEKIELEKQRDNNIYNYRKNQLEKLGFWSIFTERELMSEEGIKLSLLAFSNEEFESYLKSVEKASEPKEELISKEEVNFSGVDYENTPISESVDLPSEENKVITFEVEGNTPFGYRKNPPQEVEFEETWDSIFNDIENWNELVIPHCDIVKKYLEDIYNVPSKKQ